MKLLTIVGVFFMSTYAIACPDLEGTFNCGFPYYTMQITKTDDLPSYQVDYVNWGAQTILHLDGIEHSETYEEDGITYTKTYMDKCENDKVVSWLLDTNSDDYYLLITEVYSRDELGNLKFSVTQTTRTNSSTHDYICERSH